jgi:hypothetical protein
VPTTQHGQVFPRLTNRSATVAEVTFLGIGVVIFVIIWVAGPWLWWLAAPMIALLGYAGLVLVTQATWIDPVAGTVSRRGWRLVPTSVRLAGTTELRVAASGGGGARLVVRTADGVVVLDLVAITLFANRSQPEATLQLLADVLDEHVPAAVRGQVPARLRAQAAHLHRGGAVESSPLSAAARS